MNHFSFENNCWVKFKIDGIPHFEITRQFIDTDLRGNTVYHNYIDYMSEAYTKKLNKSRRMLWAELTKAMEPVLMRFVKPERKINTATTEQSKNFEENLTKNR
jgi:hypothetical protein